MEDHKWWKLFHTMPLFIILDNRLSAGPRRGEGRRGDKCDNITIKNTADLSSKVKWHLSSHNYPIIQEIKIRVPMSFSGRQGFPGTHGWTLDVTTCHSEFVEKGATYLLSNRASIHLQQYSGRAHECLPISQAKVLAAHVGG